MRLDKLLSNAGVCSRREAKEFIKKGKVIVNNQPAKMVDMDIDENVDVILFHGEKIVFEKYIYIMMNKPQGVVCANSDSKEKTVFDILDKDLNKHSLFIAGRLDKDTEGFLLITDNGDFAHNMLSPKKHVPKTYYAEIDGYVKHEHMKVFENGVLLDDGYICLPAELEILESGNESKIILTIHEGKFHQVKRMFKAIDTRVTFLKRIKIGGLCLDENLAAGEFKKITPEDLTKVGVKL